MLEKTMTRLRRSILTAFVLAALPITALAQDAQPDPIGRFVADVRASIPRFPSDGSIATALGVTEENLPGRGLGLSAGVHLYPLRMGKTTLGLGGELLVARAKRTLDPIVEGGQPGPTVSAQFSSLAPQVSINFGSRRGWSYLSVGFGFAMFTEQDDAEPVASGDRVKTINYGGGARWFAKEHLAFTFDLRFHRYDPQPAATGRPSYPGGRMTVLSAGISLK
jgi:hypothetical protein